MIYIECFWYKYLTQDFAHLQANSNIKSYDIFNRKPSCANDMHNMLLTFYVLVLITPNFLLLL